jgi:Inner membrane protein YgaP-like, transmembrane domain
MSFPKIISDIFMMQSALAGPLALIEGAIVLVTGIAGAFLLFTGSIGWCPTYVLLGIILIA